ncbi:MAG: hypothetical protein KKB29_01960 [Nanoarchaeota archaeon]|nr:hypothetical protein [Nanoarchaeota archaeon]
MILNNFNNVKKNYQGRFISLRTHGWVGQAQQFFFSFFFLLQYAPLPKFFRTKSKLAGKKEGGLGEGIFARPLRRLGWKRWGGVSNHSSDFRSKKVRASFSNCDQSRLSENLEAIVCSLRPAGAGLRSHFSLYFGIKSKGGRKSKRIFLSSIWRFVAAKPPEQKQSYGIFRECFCFPIFSAFVKGEQKPVFNPVLSVPSAQCPKATNLKTI